MRQIQFISITPEELKEEIIQGVSVLLVRLKEELRKESSRDDILTRAEAAKFLKISPSTLHVWTKKGKLVAYVIGGRKYYKREEVKAAIIKLNN